jgi:hypothetical protein
MAEVLLQFDAALADRSGRTYVARVCGREAEDGLWDGWIEFVPGDGGAALRTPRETRQPDRADLEYWAGGLTVTYLEGALDRALDPRAPDLRPREVPAEPAYDRPAPSSRAETERTGDAGGVRPRAVLDPFAVYAQGEEVLRGELGALDEGHLRSIARAYGLVDEDAMDPGALGRAALADVIVAAVRKRAG